MSPIPFTTPHTIATGELVTVTTMNSEWGGNVSFLANPPAVRVYRNAASTVTNNIWEALPVFDTERYDTDSMHSAVTNTGRITFNTAGLYLIGGNVEFAGNATGIRGVKVRVNNTNDIVLIDQPTSGGIFGTPIAVATVYKFAVADYAEIWCFQNSGGFLNVNNTPQYSPEFFATWIGKG